MDASLTADEVSGIRDRTAALVAASSELVTRAGRPDLADGLSAPTEVRHAPRDRPVVAVIGETSRGKSALVNALIGRPGLSPVDPQVTTCVPVLFTYDEPEWAKVWIHRGNDAYAPREPLGIAVEDIGEFAHETRNPGNAKLAQRVDVGLRSPTLAALDLTIADTPGVGGLISGHADLALAQLHGSDAVVLVLDAATEMSPSEVAFLQEAAAQVASVIIAITKTDLQFDVRRVVETNRERITAEVPELVDPPIIPVSSRLVELAERLPEPDRGETRAASGINELISVLDERVRAPRERSELATVVDRCLQRLAHLDAHLTAAAAAVDEDQLRRQLEYNESRLARLQRTRADWYDELTVRLGRLEDEVVGHPGVAGETLAAELDTLTERYRKQAKGADSQDEFDRLVIALQADAVRACAQTSVALENAVAEAFASFLEAGVELPPGTVIQPAPIAVPSVGNKPRPMEDRTLADLMTAIDPAISMNGLIMAAAGVTAATQQYWALIVIPPLAALAVRQYNARTRRLNFLEWLEDYAIAISGLARRSCEAAFTSAGSRDVRSRVDALIDAEISAAADAAEKQRSALQTDPAARNAEIDRVNAIVAELADLGGQAHHLLSSLATRS